MTRVVGPCTVIGQFRLLMHNSYRGEVLTKRVRRKVVINLKKVCLPRIPAMYLLKLNLS